MPTFKVPSPFVIKRHLIVAFAVCTVAAIDSRPTMGQEIEEIIVTARKQEESLQNAPVAVSVATGELLESMGSADLSAIGQFAPNVQFETGQPTSGIRAPTIYIRGMGQDDFIIVEDGAVGVYLDGVYVGRTVGSVFDLVDVERVEVLRGPQGTLFGKNTIGGAINLISKAPSNEAVDGNVKVAIGEDGYSSFRGVINLPLGSGESAARVSAFAHQQNGYVEALQYDDFDLGEEDVKGFRAALRVKPNDTFMADLAFDYSKDRSSPNAVTPINFLELNGEPRPTNTFGNWWNAFHSGNPACTDPTVAAVDPACYGLVYDNPDPYSTNSVFRDNEGNAIEPEQELDVFGWNLTLTLDMGWAELKSITAHRDFEVIIYNDVDFTPHLIFHNNHDDYSQDQFSQELQLSGTAFDDGMDFLIGYYHFEEDGVEDIFNQLAFPRAVAPAFFFQQVTRFIENDSQAIFAQATFYMRNNLSFTAGVRSTESDKSFRLVQPNILGSNVDATGELSISKVTPLATLAWDVNDDLMTYLTYSKGFREGGFPARFVGAIPQPLPFYDPEFVQNTEIGVKMMLADRRIRLNLALFRMAYDDILVTASTPYAVGTSTSKDNLGNATVTGLEAELTAMVTENFSINASLGTLQDDIESVTGGVLNSGSFEITTASDLPMTPDKNFSIGGQYTRQTDNGGQLLMRADYAFKDSYYTRVENISETKEDNYRVVNASVRYISPNGRWELGLWGRNLTDELYYKARRIFESLGTTFGTPVRPRSVYASFQYNFGD